MGPQTWTDSLKWPNVTSLYRSVSLKTAERKLAKYVWFSGKYKRSNWTRGGQSVDDYTLFYKNGNDNNHSETDLFIYKRIKSAVKRAESV
jgi:hypothetical protein